MTPDKKLTAIEKRNIRRIIYRSNLAMKNLDIAIGISYAYSHLLPEEVEENLRDSRLNIVQALSLIGDRGKNEN